MAAHRVGPASSPSLTCVAPRVGLFTRAASGARAQFRCCFHHKAGSVIISFCSDLSRRLISVAVPLLLWDTPHVSSLACEAPPASPQLPSAPLAAHGSWAVLCPRPVHAARLWPQGRGLRGRCSFTPFFLCVAVFLPTGPLGNVRGSCSPCPSPVSSSEALRRHPPPSTTRPSRVSVALGTCHRKSCEHLRGTRVRVSILCS